jgi:signal transduction histidine kinase
VHAITATARSLSESNLAARVGHRGPDDELKEMADTFDALLDRLERAFESQRNFVAAASHELRSPLTIMRARAEIPAPATAADGDVDLRTTVVAQVERADRLIDALLTLTRSQGTLIASDRLDFAEIVGDVLGTLSERATESGVVLDAAIDDAEVNGDAPLLERLVGNLVENAIRYNTAGGHVDVRVGGGGQPTLIVENDGPIVDAPAVASLLEPFRRGGTQRTGDGYGLGLAVVHAVAQAHGARLDLQPRPGGGLRVAVVFPALAVTDAAAPAAPR